VTGPLVKKLDVDKGPAKDAAKEPATEPAKEPAKESSVEAVSDSRPEIEESSDQSTGSENRVPAVGDDAPPVVSEKQRHKGLTRRLGQVKVAREFGPTVEVYDMSSFRIGHGIPYQFIGDLLFNDCRNYELKKDANGVLVVRRARH